MVCQLREVINGTFDGVDAADEPARCAWTEVHLEFDVPKVCQNKQCLADKNAWPCWKE